MGRQTIQIEWFRVFTTLMKEEAATVGTVEVQCQVAANFTKLSQPADPESFSLLLPNLRKPILINTLRVLTQLKIRVSVVRVASIGSVNATSL